jgi:hypothetical protein
MRAVVHIRCAVTAACLVAGLATEPATHAEDASSVQAKGDAITQCAPLVDDGARHACLDAVLRKSGLMSDATRIAVVATAAVKPPPEDLLQVTLAGVKRGGDGTLVLNTTEGAVWRRVENTALHPEPVAGDTLTIKGGLFGGYMCQSRKWIVFRCTRTH